MRVGDLVCFKIDGFYKWRNGRHRIGLILSKYRDDIFRILWIREGEKNLVHKTSLEKVE